MYGFRRLDIIFNVAICKVDGSLLWCFCVLFEAWNVYYNYVEQNNQHNLLNLHFLCCKILQVWTSAWGNHHRNVILKGLFRQKWHVFLMKSDICVSNLMTFFLRSVSREEWEPISLVLLLIRLLRLLLLLLFAGIYGYCCQWLHSGLWGQQPAGKL